MQDLNPNLALVTVLTLFLIILLSCLRMNPFSREREER
jgi:hypothetical protein